MVDVGPHPRLRLGRAPLPGLPRRHGRVGRRRQLAPRPLAHGPHRQRAARADGCRHPRRPRLCRPRRERAQRSAGRPARRSRDVGARDHPAAGARLLLRHARERRRDRVRPPRRRRPCRRSHPDDLVETRPEAPLATLTRAQETDLPASAKVTYITAGGDYAGSRGGSAPPRRPQRPRGARRSAPGARAEQAAEIAEVWLFEAWAARERAKFALPPSRLALEPGDVVGLAANGRSHLLRITEVGEHGVRDIEARGLDPDVYAQRAGRRPRPGRQRRRHRRPAVRGVPRPAAAARRRAARRGYVAAAQSPWPGPIAIYRSPDDLGLPAGGAGAGLRRHRRHPRPAARRRHLALRPRHQPSASSSTAARSPPSPSSPCSAAPTSPPFATRMASGRCCSSSPPPSPRPRPTRSPASCAARPAPSTPCAAPVAAGARFVLLDGAPARIDLTEDEIGLAYNWKCGPASRDIGSPNYVDATHTFTGEGLKPLSPVHVRGLAQRRRRPRSDVGAPHAHRRRQLGLRSTCRSAKPRSATRSTSSTAATSVRTLTATSPAATYTAAEQTADFGAPQSSISLRLYQLSATRGRGTPRAAIV